MNNTQRITIGIFLLMTVSVSSAESMQERMEKWYQSMNSSSYSNLTEAEIYESQSARYLTFGGFSRRTAIKRPLKLIDVTVPKFSAGCGGIDFYGGGLKMINANQFIEHLKAMGQNAESLAYMLAIQIVSPQLSSIMAKIQDFADDYLSMSMDSCRAASKLVGGALKYLDKEKANCISVRQQKEGITFAEASKRCSHEQNKLSTIEEYDKSKDHSKNIAYIEGNVAWDTLKGSYFLPKENATEEQQKFAELIMNITGTIILKDAGQPRTVQPAISGEITRKRFDDIYNALLFGNSADASDDLLLYTCDDDYKMCLKISHQPELVTVSWKGMYDKISNLLKSIIQKVEKDEKLKPDEQHLIAVSKLPIYRYISAATTFYHHSSFSKQATEQYTAMIAQDLLLDALSSIVEVIEDRASNDQFSDDEVFKEYRENLSKVLNGLALRRKENEYSAEKIVKMREEIVKYEQILLSSLSENIRSALLWNKK